MWTRVSSVLTRVHYLVDQWYIPVLRCSPSTQDYLDRSLTEDWTRCLWTRYPDTCLVTRGVSLKLDCGHRSPSPSIWRPPVHPSQLFNVTIVTIDLHNSSHFSLISQHLKALRPPLSNSCYHRTDKRHWTWESQLQPHMLWCKSFEGSEPTASSAKQMFCLR